jgi:hypothetical protein
VKKLFRTIKKKLSPLMLIPVVLLALILVGGYFLFFNDDDGDNTSNASSTVAPPPPTTTPTTPGKPKQDPAAKPPPAAGKSFLIDSDREEKNYAIAQAIGSITDPQSLTLRVGAAPKQPVTIEASLTCTLPDERAKSNLDVFTVTPPAEPQLKIPVKDPVKCEVSASARLTRAGKGRVKVFLMGVRRSGA